MLTVSWEDAPSFAYLEDEVVAGGTRKPYLTGCIPMEKHT